MNREEVNKYIMQSSETILSFDWEDPDFYNLWLAQTYYFVCHSTKLLNLSACYLDQKEEKLYSRFVDHISEEIFHEKLVLSDLKKKKFKIQDFQELTSTKNFYRSQYFLMNNEPTSLLGYILFLEAIAITAGSEVAKRTEPTHGVSSFLRVHVEEDVDHIDKAFDAVNCLTESQKEKAFINFRDTANGYMQILNEIKSKAGLKNISKAA